VKAVVTGVAGFIGSTLAEQLVGDGAGSRATIGIDGGIDHENVGRIVAAGARVVVAGSAIFHTADPERATRDLKTAAGAALGSPVGPVGTRGTPA